MGLEVYSEADYTRLILDRILTARYFFLLGLTLVALKSKKQSFVARSSAEEEFRIMIQGICELLRLKIILEELSIKLDEPMRLYCDRKKIY